MVHLRIAILALPLVMVGCAQLTTYSSNTVTKTPSYSARAVNGTLEKSTYTKGIEAVEAEDYAKANSFLTRHVQANPEEPYGLFALGSVKSRMGQTDDALTYYRLAARYGMTAPIDRVIGDVEGNPRTIAELATVTIAALEPTKQPEAAPRP